MSLALGNYKGWMPKTWEMKKHYNVKLMFYIRVGTLVAPRPHDWMMWISGNMEYRRTTTWHVPMDFLVGKMALK